MAGFILVIDPQDRLSQVLELVVAGADLGVVRVRDFISAKKKLVQAIPELVISELSIAGDPQAGIKFHVELKGHSILSKVPLVLCSDNLTEEIKRVCSSSGVAAAIPWPLSWESLKYRLSPILPQLSERKSAGKENSLSEQASAVVSKTSGVNTPEAKAGQVAARQIAPAQQQAATVENEKLHLAQQLLARVLHNLKTSDLLTVVEIEDVPRVVFEMTRSICGISTDDSIKTLGASPKPEQDVELDLDKAFGLKSN